MSQVITLILDSKPTSVLCHMGEFGCGDGGWTPVMKIDGNKVYFLGLLPLNKCTYFSVGGLLKARTLRLWQLQTD